MMFRSLDEASPSSCMLKASELKSGRDQCRFRFIVDGCYTEMGMGMLVDTCQSSPNGRVDCDMAME